MKSLEDLSSPEVDAIMRHAYDEFANWRINPASAGLAAKLRGHINVLNELARHRPEDARRINGLAGRLERFRVEIAGRS